MSKHIIHLLPDNIANQIAAGEVVQRPSSAVKELLENAIDANASEIKLIVKEGGKTLIQVIDNGKGMSEVDARMSFERHATSKIRNTDDLFSIKTMGFRGEALASIAAIAHVELITREADAEVATKINMNGTILEKQGYTQAPVGTSISVKNLFFNVPARRKFLKTDATEYKHVLDEFHRIVLSYPEIKFSLFHNNNEIYHLPKGNLRQRLVGVFGKAMNERLVPIDEDTEMLGISGFIVKPRHAKKSRNEQYLFVNKRFVKSPYLNHGIRNAFESLITADLNPGYFINITIDPEKVDVNVHPTKQEIKFAEERLVYNYLKVAVRHALGKNNLTPSLDFDSTNYNLIQNTPSHSPISRSSNPSFQPSVPSNQKENIKHWESLYDGMIEVEKETDQEEYLLTIPSKISSQNSEDLFHKDFAEKQLFQLHNRYILSPIASGFMMIDQIAAHERIIFEEQLASVKGDKLSTQKVLFPETIELSAGQAELLLSALSSINKMGFDIQHFGKNSFVVHGVPSGMESETNMERLLSGVLEDFTLNRDAVQKEEEIAKILAKKMAMNKARKLTNTEMQHLVNQLFACKSPYISPSNKSVIINYDLEEIKNRFKINK